MALNLFLPLEPIAPSLRRAYHAPRLELLGDLRGLTLGGSPGTADSANNYSCDPSQGCLNLSDPFNDQFSGGSGH